MLVPYLDQTTPNDMKHGHYLVLSAKCLTSRSGEFISCGRVDRIMYFWDASSLVKVHHIRSHAEAQCYLYCLLGLILYKIYSLPYTYYKKEVRTMTSYSTWYHRYYIVIGAMLVSKEWRHVFLCPPPSPTENNDVSCPSRVYCCASWTKLLLKPGAGWWPNRTPTNERCNQHWKRWVSVMELFRVEFGSFRVNGRYSMCREPHSLGPCWLTSSLYATQGRHFKITFLGSLQTLACNYRICNIPSSQRGIHIHLKV